MNKNAIKEFAINARLQLLSEVAIKARYFGIGDGGYLPVSTVGDAIVIEGVNVPYSLNGKEASTRNRLIEKIESLSIDSDYVTAYQSIIEEVAYTWFNRICAIRFMEVNDYLPSKIRILSSVTDGKDEPDIVSTPFDALIDYTDAEKEIIYTMQMDATKQNELFKFLFIKQCNSLSDILPGLFEQFEDYTEMMLDLKFTNEDSVVRKIVSSIDENDWTDAVEIIGWLYQYYNTMAKNEANTDDNSKVDKSTIPAVTQLFTPDWIVRYMVENSIGKKYIDYIKSLGGDASITRIGALKSKWIYFIDSAEFEYQQNFDITSISMIDPCMGSGHILTYSFELLMDIYKDLGYSEREIPTLIVSNNLYGIDIDTRAYQLAYFAVMMKARKYDRRFFAKDIKPNVIAITESNTLDVTCLDYLGNGMDESTAAIARQEVEYIINAFYDARIYGSAIKFTDPIEFDLIEQYLNTYALVERKLDTYALNREIDEIKVLINQAKMLSSKYDAVITNPPYLGSKRMDEKLSSFVKREYPDSKSDLFAVFIEHGFEMIKNGGYNAMVTMQSWMFLSSYEKMRTNIVTKYHISSMVHMDNMVMGIAFGTSATVFKKEKNDLLKAQYQYITTKDLNQNNIPTEFPVVNDRYKKCSSENFSKIPGSPISAYWANEDLVQAFVKGAPLGEIASPKTGMTTGNNSRFLRLWHEVDDMKIKFDASNEEEALASMCKWFPYCKGGGHIRWYGHNEYLVNWLNDGYDIKNNIKENGKKAASVRSEHMYFKKLVTWSAVSTKGFSCRLVEGGFLFDSGGSSIELNEHEEIILAVLNSCVSKQFFSIYNDTINFQPGDVARIPIIVHEEEKVKIIVQQNIDISKTDWDSFETSWDFKKHPLI